jgi:predicted DCC family thiol-disulfide oxidoreductase YuxK
MKGTDQPISNYPCATVFFDGGCPLCSREIAHYQRLDKKGDLLWVDITREVEQVRLSGCDPVDLMQRFHVRDIHGNWRTGAWGFAEMWAHLPYYRWLSLTLRFTRLLPVLDWLYGHFARWRMRGRCEDQCMPAQGHKP